MSDYVRLQCAFPTSIPGVTFGGLNLVVPKADFYRVRNTPGFYTTPLLLHVVFPNGCEQIMKVVVVNTEDVPAPHEEEGENWKQ